MSSTANPRYRKPDAEGRKPETWPPIPFENGRRIPRYITDALEEWLKTKRGATRGMPIAAPLLAIVCELHRQGHWMPVRRRLAEVLNTGEGWDADRGEVVWKPYSIDAALSTALGNGEIFERHKTEEGDVDGRSSIRRHRYMVPSKELLAAYEAALEGAPPRRKQA